MEPQKEPQKKPEHDAYVEEEEDYLSNPFFIKITHKIHGIITSDTKEMALERGDRH